MFLYLQVAQFGTQSFALVQARKNSFDVRTTLVYVINVCNVNRQPQAFSYYVRSGFHGGVPSHCVHVVYDTVQSGTWE